MKNYSIVPILLLVFLFGSTKAQKVIEEIDVPKGHTIEDVQVISFQDSLLVMFTFPYPPKGHKPFNSLLIWPNGDTLHLNLSDLNGRQLCGITSHGSQVKRFYFFDQVKKNIVIKAIELDLKNNRTKLLTGFVSMTGRFLGADVSGEQLMIYSYERKKFTLQETIIKNIEVLKTNLYDLSIDLSNYKDRDISIIPENSFGGSLQAKSKVKIFLNKEEIAITVDRFFDEYDQNPQITKTDLIRINRLTGVSEFGVFGEESKGVFSSMYYKTLLFRIINHAEFFGLQVFDGGTRKALYSNMVPVDKTMNNQFVYFRQGRANLVSKSETLSRMMKTSRVCEPFIIVNYDSTGDRYMITWGTYFDEKGIGSPIGINPLAALVTMAVSTAVLQISEGPGVSRYFYMVGNPKEGFNISGDSISLRSHVDSYEIEQQELKVKYKYKGYFQYKEGVVAFYHDARNNKIRLVEF